jgi:SOS-response transcriptional repressor LexA
MMGLTPRQWELLRFIHGRMEKTRVPPSYDEMRDHLQLASKSGVCRLVNLLADRGAITMQKGRPRSIRVVGDNQVVGGRNVALPLDVFGKAEAAARKLGMTVDGFVSSAVEIMADGGFRT